MSDILKSVAAARQTSKTALSNINEGLAAVRSQVSNLKADRVKVGRAAVPLDVALKRIEEWVDRETVAHRYVLPSPEQFATPDFRSPQCKIEHALAALMGEYVAETMKERVTAQYQSVVFLDDTAREQKLKALDRQLLDCELAEESIIRQAELSGFPVCRRADADPRAVLAHDRSLP